MNLPINRAGTGPRPIATDVGSIATATGKALPAEQSTVLPPTSGAPDLAVINRAPTLSPPKSGAQMAGAELDPELLAAMLQILQQGGSETDATRPITDNADKLRQDAAPSRTEAIKKAGENFNADFFGGVMSFVSAVSKNFDKILPAVTNIATSIAAAVANPAMIPNAVMSVATNSASVLMPVLADMGVDVKTALAEPTRALAVWLGADPEQANRIAAAASASLLAIGNLALSVMDPQKFPFDAKLMGDAAMDIAVLIQPDRTASQLQALGAAVVSSIGPLVAAATAAVGLYTAAAGIMSGNSQSLTDQLPNIAVSLFKQSVLGLDAGAAGGADADRLAGLLVGAFNGVEFKNAFAAFGNLYAELNAFANDQSSGIKYQADTIQRYRPMQSFA